MSLRARWILGAVIVVVLLGVIYMATRPTPATGESIKIGAAYALTGDAAPWGEESLRAAQLAVKEINADGGINGRPLELVVEDIKSSSAGSVSAVSKLVNVNKVAAVMITWLDSYQGSESTVPKDMLLISQDAAIESVNVPVNHENVFSVWYRTQSKAQVTFDAIEKSGAKKLYIVLQNDSYYATLAKFLADEAEARGIEVVAQEMLNPTQDPATVVAKISEANPDAVFFGSYDEKLSLGFIKRYRELNVTVPLFGDEFMDQYFTSENFNPAWFEGVAYYVPADPDKRFASKFRDEYGHDPMFSAGTTYDTIHVVAKMLRDNPENLSEYMRSTEFDTMTYGTISFDDIGGVVSKNTAITEKIIKNGKVEEYRRP